MHSFCLQYEWALCIRMSCAGCWCECVLCLCVQLAAGCRSVRAADSTSMISSTYRPWTRTGTRCVSGKSCVRERDRAASLPGVCTSPKLLLHDLHHQDNDFTQVVGLESKWWGENKMNGLSAELFSWAAHSAVIHQQMTPTHWLHQSRSFHMLQKEKCWLFMAFNRKYISFIPCLSIKWMKINRNWFILITQIFVCLSE